MKGVIEQRASQWALRVCEQKRGVYIATDQSAGAQCATGVQSISEPNVAATVEYRLGNCPTSLS